MVKLLNMSVWRVEPDKYRNGKRPDVHLFMKCIRNEAEKWPDDPKEKVELSADVFKLLVDIADGKISAPQGRPTRGPFEQLSHLWTSKLYISAVDVERFKRVQRLRHGRVKGVESQAIEWAAHKWDVDQGQLANFHRRNRTDLRKTAWALGWNGKYAQN